MPIRASEKARYPADWKRISREVREAAGNKCEKCGAPNGEYISRGTGFAEGTYMLMHGQVHCAETGDYKGMARGSEYPTRGLVRIILTVAHLDHQPENCARENLRAWCQRCHLRYDAKHHAANSAATRRSRKAAGDLFTRAAAQEKGGG